ncbi:membrane-associated, eicosanoid/glutathione metabolism protein [Lineolata rhizophorae]|uniref:Membrane-associated, eicosanoid/glutathione metabolism protein n=1 Tax=Lineolata rhizophorae TaxID=578093 RepID=A0A6A6P6P7_9PEZI|nr:membrane-associated, eicosanoid/glutathione metabolism protein [Lineolata rhizophorae]
MKTNAVQLPVAGTWALPFAAYYAFLANRIVYYRLKHSKYSGESTGEAGTESSDPAADPLFCASRAHANFGENVPVTLLLAIIAELNGADRRRLHYVLGLLLALRVLQAELGLARPGGRAQGRTLGYFGTQGIMLGLAGWAGKLVGYSWS